MMLGLEFSGGHLPLMPCMPNWPCLFLDFRPVTFLLMCLVNNYGFAVFLCIRLDVYTKATTMVHQVFGGYYRSQGISL